LAQLKKMDFVGYNNSKYQKILNINLAGFALTKLSEMYILKVTGDYRMNGMVLDVQELPETVYSIISTRKINFFEENGIITLTPFLDAKPRFDMLVGMFSDGKMSVDGFLAEKRREMELE